MAQMNSTMGAGGMNKTFGSMKSLSHKRSLIGSAPDEQTLAI
jgi:hypothetical protein